MSFTKVRISVENYVGKKTVFTPFVMVAGLTFAAIGSSLMLGGCTPAAPEGTLSNDKEVNNNESSYVESSNTEESSVSDVDLNSSDWSEIDTYNLDDTAKFIKDTCTRFNKNISDVEAKDVAELAQKLSIFSTHAKSDITNGASESTLAKNKEVIIDANKTDAAMDKGSKEVKSERDKNNISDILLDLSTDYKICKSLRLVGATNGNVGDTVTLKAQCTPANAEVKYEYKSSDTKIATVSQDGKVKLVSAGNVTITVTDKNTGVSDSRNISISKKSEAKKEEQKQTENKKAEQKKDNGNSGQSGGQSGNSGNSGSGNSGQSSSNKKQEQRVVATGVTLDNSSLSMTAGYGHELNAYILWSNNTQSYQGITWSSNNSSVASVNSTGYVTAKSAGTATITASYGSFKKTCTVTVKAAQVSQPSKPSGGSSGGNRGSTSKPSGGGNSGGGSSQTTKPSTPTETSSTDNYYDAKYYPKGDFFKSHGCPVVKTMSGRTTYDITAYILPTINKYRQQEGKQTLVADTYEHEYNFLCDYGQYLKNNRPRRAERIKAGEDSNFNSNFKPKSELFNRDIYNEGVVELANCIELASAGGHGDGHGANILTDWGNFDMDRGIGGMKQRSSSHWSSLMDSDATSVKVILWISNDDAALGNQGYHLAIAMGWDDFDSCGW